MVCPAQTTKEYKRKGYIKTHKQTVRAVDHKAGRRATINDMRATTARRAVDGVHHSGLEALPNVESTAFVHAHDLRLRHALANQILLNFVNAVHLTARMVLGQLQRVSNVVEMTVGHLVRPPFDEHAKESGEKEKK